MNKAYTSTSYEATYCLGKQMGERAFPGMVILLYGDLGAGKTALTQGLAAGMGIKDTVSSPTYTIVHEHPGLTPLYHFDLYRLEGEDDFYHIGGYEYLDGAGVCVFEWPERMDWGEVDGYLRVNITYGQNDDERRIEFEPIGAAYLQWMEHMNDEEIK